MRHFNQSAGGGGMTGLEPAGDLNSPEGLVREVGTISGLWRDLFKRGALVRTADGGYVVKAEDDVRQLEQREEDLLKRFDNLETIVKSNASKFAASDSDRVTLSKAAMALEPSDDLAGVDKTYLNIMALSAAELAGVCQLGAEHIPGMAPKVREWAGNPRNQATVQLVNRAHELNDRLVIKYHWLSTNRNWARQFSTPEAAMRTFREWPEYERLMGEILRAMDETTAGKGLNLVPTIMSGSINDILELQLRVAALIPRFTMTSKTFEWPIQTGRVTIYSPGESTGDHGTYDVGITASTPAFLKATWTAKKLAGLCFVSSEVNEDAIEPGVAFVQNDMGMALGNAVEEGFISGEKAGYTMDGQTFNPDAGTYGRRFVNGLRFHALMTGSYPAALDMGNAVLTTEKAIDLQDSMGVWGAETGDFVWITGFKAYNSIRKLADFRTMAQVGDRAVILRGQVGEFLGSPLIRSQKLGNFNASGKYDGSTTNRGSLIGLCPSRWAYGDRRGVTVDTSTHVAFRNDQIAIRGTLRGDLEPIDTPSATVTPVGLIFNIA